MARPLLCLLTLVFLWPAFFEGQTNTFFRKYNLTGMQGGLQIEAIPNDGFVATGQHQDNGSAGGCDIYVYRVDECGNTLWFKLFGTPGGDGGKSIKMTSDGGFIVSGHYSDSQGFNMKIDQDGNLQWAKGYSGTTWVFYTDECANGDFISIGQNSAGLYLFRTDSQGNVLWSNFLNGLGTMGFYVKELDNKDFVMTSSYGLSGKDVALSRFDPNGNLVYSYAYGSGWSEGDHTSWSCKGLVDEPSGSILITAPTFLGSGGEDVLLIKADLASGDVVWSNAYGGSGSDQSREIAHHPGGFAVIGNTNSFPVSAGSAPGISESMGERDVLLINVDDNGELIWSRTYGGSNRDRGIGVKYNADGGYSMSAFSNSPYFGNGGEMDPVFIKTDSLGFVTCQTHSPSLVKTPLTLTKSAIGSISGASITANQISPTVNNYMPNDAYVCQDCLTEPLFQASDTIVCVNEPVEFYNTTQVGLTCFQEWNVDGNPFNGGLDTITYSFPNQGVYTVTLTSNCGNANNTYITNVYIYGPEIDQEQISDYNGFGVTCPGETDGWIETVASSGYAPNGVYTYEWSPPVSTTPDASGLSPGEYLAIVTDQVGCRDTVAITITEPPPITASATPTSNFNGFHVDCADSENGTASATASGGAGGYTYSWSSSPPKSGDAVTGLLPGPYTITVTDANGCIQTTTTTLTSPPPITGAITVLSNYNGFEVSCHDGNDGVATFNAGGGVVPYGIMWNGQPITNGQQMTGLSQQNLLVEVTDANGCPASFTSELNDPPALTTLTTVISDYNGEDISCVDSQNGRAGTTPSGGVSPYSYSWSDGSSGMNSFFDLAPGYAYVTVTDDNGCIYPDSVLITAPDSLQLTLSITTDYNGFPVSCFAGSDGGTLANASGGVGGFQYFWSSSPPTLEADASGLQAGTYTATATDANGCVIQDQITLTQPTPVQIVVTPTSDYNGYEVSCFGASDGTANATASGGVGGYTYQWQTDPVIDGADATGLSAGFYAATATDANGCQVTGATDLFEPLDITGAITILSDYNGYPISCFEGSDGSATFSATGGVQPYNLLWNGSAYNMNDVQSGLSQQPLSVNLVDQNGCTKVFDSSISHPDEIESETTVISDYNGSQISCDQGSDGQAATVVTGGVEPYAYNWVDGSAAPESFADLPAGYAWVEITDLNNCIKLDSVQLVAPPPLTLTADILSDYNGYGVSCFGSSDGLMRATGGGGTPPLDYWWSDGESEYLNEDAAAGTYSVFITDANLCDTLESVLDLTEPTPLSIDDEITSDYNGYDISCYDYADGSIDAVISGSVPPYTYAWNGGMSGNPVQNLTAGTYAYTVTDDNGCEISHSVTLTEPDEIKVIYDSDPDTCLREVGVAYLDIIGGVTPYGVLWEDGQTGQEACCLYPGIYTYVITDANGCIRQSAASVENLAGPVADFQWWEPPLCSSKDITFEDRSTEKPVKWDWDFGNGHHSTLKDPTFHYDDPGDYFVRLTTTNVYGCVDDTLVPLKVYPDMRVFIPNTFTPNQDGLNEGFGPIGEGIISYEMTVRSRWGVQVFESSEDYPVWNGSHFNTNESTLQEAYIYHIKAKGYCENKEFRGHVLLVR